LYESQDSTFRFEPPQQLPATPVPKAQATEVSSPPPAPQWIAGDPDWKQFYGEVGT